MNQFFYEARGKEKLRDLINESMRSQVAKKSAAPTARIRRSGRDWPPWHWRLWSSSALCWAEPSSIC
jgi:hypothetical protein